MGDYQGFRVVEHYCINHRWFYTRFRERFPVRVPPLYFLFTYPVYPVTGIRARSFIRGHELCPQPSGDIYHHAGIHKRYIVVLGRSGARNVWLFRTYRPEHVFRSAGTHESRSLSDTTLHVPVLGYGITFFHYRAGKPSSFASQEKYLTQLYRLRYHDSGIRLRVLLLFHLPSHR